MPDRPLSRQMGCPACPHEHHLLPCSDDPGGCDCHDVPLPGIYPEES